jgi:hypothetical protein
MTSTMPSLGPSQPRRVSVVHAVGDEGLLELGGGAAAPAGRDALSGARQRHQPRRRAGGLRDHRSLPLQPRPDQRGARGTGMSEGVPVSSWLPSSPPRQRAGRREGGLPWRQFPLFAAPTSLFRCYSRQRQLAQVRPAACFCARCQEPNTTVRAKRGLRAGRQPMGRPASKGGQRARNGSHGAFESRPSGVLLRLLGVQARLNPWRSGGSATVPAR